MKKILLILICTTLIGNAQITFEPTYNLSNTPSATSDYHSVYTFDMFFYVVWGDNGEIKFKSSQNFGLNWSNNVTISNTENICGYPVVVGEGQYNIYVLYHTIAAGGNYEIIFQQTTNGGASWSAMQKISGTASAITPQLGLIGATLYAVWEERPNNNYEIYFSKYSNNTWSTPQNISNTSTSSRWVQLQGDGQNLYCAWIETSTYPLSDIYFIKSTNRGDNWSLPVNITNDDRPQNRIFMKHAYGNTLYLASDDIITFNFDEVFLLKTSDGGDTWSTPINITNNSGNSNTPCIETLGDHIFFTWSDNSHSAPAYDNSDIFYKLSYDGGVTWTDSMNLSNNSETSSRPRICYGWDGPIPAPYLRQTVVWYDYSTGDSELLARNGIYQFVPVELVSFTAMVNFNDVQLKWVTATETNNRGFDVEKRIIGSKQYALGNDAWRSIGFVEGKGTTTEAQSYSFADEEVMTGRYQYRLKQIDFDGSYEYSNTVEVEVNLITEFVLDQNYPNPFNPTTKIGFTIPSVTLRQAQSDTRVTLKVYDVLGNEVATLVDEYKESGRYEIEFDASNLSSGVYYYQLKSGSFTQIRKMILLK